MGNDGVTWGPVFDDDLHTIQLDSENWVKVLRYVTEGVEAAALDAAKARYRMATGGNRAARRARRGGNQETDFHFDTGAYQLELLKRIVKDWGGPHFEKNGSPIPVTPENVSRLPKHTRARIMEEVDEINPELDEAEVEELKSDFPSSSPETETAPASSSLSG